MRHRWVYINGEAREVVEDYVAEPRTSGPMVMPDIKPYQSVVTGEEVGGRRQHREHLRAHDLVEVGNDPIRPKKMPDVPGRREAIIRASRKAGLLR